ncbi:hypothetical protein [Azospirillum soli]|uniref:hypothetical protein n=1 Tax=Azospirillum soli TaxID=1304799 RepID=UPI001AE7C132|nr:hypothetical protein [Azospirillum soli]MBP2310816.1 hypothetical protein [Azospirillum soli]
MRRPSSARKPAELALVSSGTAPRQEPETAEKLPLHDHSCPRREVAVLGEVDSGFRWEYACPPA